MTTHRFISSITIILFTLLSNPGIVNADQGDILLRFRGIGVVPLGTSDQVNVGGLGTVQNLIGGGSSRVDVDSAIVPEVDITYMLTDNIGIEAIAGITNHDVNLRNDGLATLITTLTADATGSALVDQYKIFDTWLLPPTVTLQYHFMPDNNFRPYAGLGVNLTLTFGDDPTDALESEVGGTVDVSTKDDFTWAAQVGFDYDISDTWYFNFDLKYIDLDTTATLDINGGLLDGTTLKVKTDISPIVIGVGFGTTF